MTELLCRVDELEMQNDVLQQRNRLPCLIFSGPAIPPSASPAESLELIQRIIRDYMYSARARSKTGEGLFPAAQRQHFR